MPNAFGQVIPVSGPNVGFPGKVSRLGERVIAARQVLSTSANPILFGQACTIIPGSDTYQSIADFINGGGTFTDALFAGIAISEVETTQPYSGYMQPANQLQGSYLQGLVAEVLERGSIVVPIPVGTPVSQNPVYVRVALNGAIPLGIVGDLEAAADGGNTVVLTNVVFRNNQLDANGMAEITLKIRKAA